MSIPLRREVVETYNLESRAGSSSEFSFSIIIVKYYKNNDDGEIYFR